MYKLGNYILTSEKGANNGVAQLDSAGKLLTSQVTLANVTIDADVIITDSRATKKGLEYAADYSGSFTARSLVDKAYVDANSGGGNSIYSANDTIGTGRVATLTDTLDFYEGTFNLFGLDKTKKIVFIGGDSDFGNQTTYVNNALNLKYNTSNGRGQIYAIDSVGNQGKLNFKGSEVEIESIKTNDQFIIGAGANGNQQGATRSIEYKFNDDYTWKGINLLSTLTYPTAKFEIQPSPNGVVGTYDTAFRVNGNKTVDILGLDTLATSSAFRIYDGDSTPNLLWDFRNNGDVHINQNSVFDLGGNNLTFLKDSSNGGNGIYMNFINAAITTSNSIFKIDTQIDVLGFRSYFEIGHAGQTTIRSGNSSFAFRVLSDRGNDSKFEVERIGGGFWYGASTEIGQGTQNNSLKQDTTGTNFYRNTGDLHHKFGLAGGGNIDTYFFGNGYSFTAAFIVGASSKIGSERISLQGDTLINGTLDMNNNRITKAVVNPSVQEVTSSATFTINADEQSDGVLTAMAAATTIASPTGTPVQSQSLVFRFKDDGTARAITWNAIFRAIGITLPTTTTASKLLYVGCKYNSTDTKWDVVSVQEEA